MLEAQRHHGPAYCDAHARITSPATAVGRAFAGHPGDHCRLGGGLHAVHAVPLAAGASRRLGALAVQHRQPDHRLSPAQHTALLRLSAETTAWHSWYRRTVLLDALEHLHTEATPHPA